MNRIKNQMPSSLWVLVCILILPVPVARAGRTVSADRSFIASRQSRQIVSVRKNTNLFYHNK